MFGSMEVQYTYYTYTYLPQTYVPITHIYIHTHPLGLRVQPLHAFGGARGDPGVLGAPEEEQGHLQAVQQLLCVVCFLYVLFWGEGEGGGVCGWSSLSIFFSGLTSCGGLLFF